MQVVNRFYIAAIFVSACIYVVVDDALVRQGLGLFGYIAGAAFIIWGTRAHRPSSRRWWYLLAGVVISSACSPLIGALVSSVTSAESGIVAVELWGSIFGFVSMVCVFALLGAGRFFRSTVAFVDAGIYVNVATVMVWIFDEQQDSYGEPAVLTASHLILRVALCSVLGVMLRAALSRRP